MFCSECGDRSVGRKAVDLYYIQDAAIAQTYALLAIEEEGLGTFIVKLSDLGSCWVGGFDQEKVQRILNIPSHFRPVGIQVCGYRKSKPSHFRKEPQKSYSFLESSVFFTHFFSS